MKRITIALAMLATGACQQTSGSSAEGSDTLGDMSDTRPFDGIAQDEALRFTGTEPFWGGSVDGESLTWTTPENIAGETITVTRFAGRGGLNFSGELQGRPFDLAITPGDCSDGMSDRTYPFVVTVMHGDAVLNGCAWRESDVLAPA